MAAKTPNRADVFNRGEALAFLSGKQTTLQADVFRRGESLGALLKTTAPAATTLRLRTTMGVGL